MKTLLTLTFSIISLIGFSQVIDQDYITSITGTTSFGGHPLNQNNNQGQSFTADTAANLVGIKVIADLKDDLQSCNCGDRISLLIELHAGEGFAGNVIGNSEIKKVGIGLDTILFDFSSSIPLTKDGKYTWEVKRVAEDCSGIGVSLEAVYNGSYSGGAAYNNGVVSSGGQDIMFQTIVGESVTFIGEDYISSLTSTTSFGGHPLNQNNNQGQSFTADTVANLVGIKVIADLKDDLQSCNCGDRTSLLIELHAGEGFAGDVIGNSEIKKVGIGLDTILFDFSSSIPLTKDGKYTWEVKRVAEDCSGIGVSLEAVYNGSYGGGAAYNNGVVSSGGQDIMFQTVLELEKELLSCNPGDIIITEILQNPAAVADNSGEWFEVYNSTALSIDMAGWIIADNVASHLISGSTIVAPYSYFVFGGNSDENTNGNVTVNYSYGSDLALGNSGDEVVIKCGSVVIDKVDYSLDFPRFSGKSMQFVGVPNSITNDLGSNWTYSTKAFGIGDLGTPGSPNDMIGNVWINEIHYDNSGPDIDEGVEVIAQKNTDLACYNLLLYNGLTGFSYSSVQLSGTTSDSCFEALWFPFDVIQNGSPDGVSLVFEPTNTGCSAGGVTTVVQFLSYEGVVAATDGPALGLTSVDIGVFESGSENAGNSLQLQGNGSKFSDFTWASTGLIASRGLLNELQTLVDTACTNVIVTGMEENTIFNSVLIYPNPTHGNVNIDLGTLSGVSIEVVSVSGQIIYRIENQKERFISLNTALSPGLYSIHIKSADEQGNYTLIVY